MRNNVQKNPPADEAGGLENQESHEVLQDIYSNIPDEEQAESEKIISELHGIFGGMNYGTSITGAVIDGQRCTIHHEDGEIHIELSDPGLPPHYLRAEAYKALGLPIPERIIDRTGRNRRGRLEPPNPPDQHAFGDAFDPDQVGGLIGDITRWINHTAVVPAPEFAAAASVALMAALWGDRVLTPINTGINVYLGALMETAGGKGHPMKCATNLAGAMGAKDSFIKGTPYSFAGFERKLRERPGHSVAFALDEFGEKMRTMSSGSIVGGLMEIYDQATQDTYTGGIYADGNRPADEMSGPSLTILGTSTPSTFSENISEAAFRNGFVNRFVFFRAEDALFERTGSHIGNSTPPPELVKRMQDAFTSLQGVGNMVGRIDTKPENRFIVPWEGGENGRAVHRFYEVREWQRHPEVRAGFVNAGAVHRAAENTARLATIRAISRNPASPSVSMEDVDWGWALVAESIDIVRDVASELGNNTEEARQQRAILEALQRAKGNRLPNSKLMAASGVSKNERLFKAAIGWLLTSGQIERVEDKRPGYGSWRLVRAANDNRPEG